MARLRHPRMVNLICLVRAARRDLLNTAVDELEKAFGPAEVAEHELALDKGEGSGPRSLLSFRELILPDNVATVKHTAERLERELAAGTGEAAGPVSIEAGYLSLEKLVLACADDGPQRVYVGGGVYAEPALHWQDGAFRPWDWTDGAFRAEACREFLGRARALYERKLAEGALA